MISWAALLAGCSGGPPADPRSVADANDTGSALAGKDESERTLLRQLPELANGTPRQLAGATVVADAPYPAASGRTCRNIHLSDARKQVTHRLACSNGKSWFFVPDVFGANRESD